MCGENGTSIFSPLIYPGSPPRVRGKLVTFPCGCLFYGITPACAGKTQPGTRTIWEDKDHPRVCGENLLTLVCYVKILGSPPRVRGKLALTLAKKKSKRITPACAGKTYTTTYDSYYHRDHPRVCGENVNFWSLHCLALGSPPRVRGKQMREDKYGWHVRITPACAGKTFRKSLPQRAGQDHPRVCGENYPVQRVSLHATGSPPRVRGKQYIKG